MINELRRELRGVDDRVDLDSFVRHAEVTAETIAANISCAAVDFGDFPAATEVLHSAMSSPIAWAREAKCRFVRDSSELRRHSLIGGRLSRIELLGGDDHGAKAPVVAFHTEGGSIVHKPRSISTDALFGSALALLSDSPRIPAVLQRQGYSWHEGLPSSELPRGETYYQRLGAILVTASALGSVDLHRENVICTGDSPVVVDTETVLQPQFARPACIAADLLAHSVGATGMLGHPTRETIPTIDNSYRNHAAAIIDGATSALALLRERGNEMRALIAGYSDPVRCIVRPTALYASLLQLRLDEKYLRVPDEFRLFCLSLPGADLLGETALNREITMLSRGHIPIFHVTPDARSLSPGGREFVETARERSYRCLALAENLTDDALAQTIDAHLGSTRSVKEPPDGIISLAHRDEQGVPRIAMHRISSESADWFGPDLSMYHGGGALLSVAKYPASQGMIDTFVDYARDMLSRSHGENEEHAGPFTGDVSTWWLSHELFAVTGDIRLAKARDDLASVFLARLPDRNLSNWDLASGGAGIVAMLSSAAHVPNLLPGPVIASLNELAGRLFSEVVAEYESGQWEPEFASMPPESPVTVPGVAHGWPGRAWALARVANLESVRARPELRPLLREALSRIRCAQNGDPTWCSGRAGLEIAEAEIALALDTPARGLSHRACDANFEELDATICHGLAGIRLARLHRTGLGATIDDVGATTFLQAEGVPRRSFEPAAKAWGMMTGQPGISLSENIIAGLEPTGFNPVALTVSRP